MEETTCCEKLVAELDAWKEKADHIATELDNMPSSDKEKVLAEVIKLHMFVEELCDRIDGLRINCPEAWEPAEIGVIEVKTHTTWQYGAKTEWAW